MEIPPLYLEAVRTLAKAEGRLLPRTFVRNIHTQMDGTDAKAHAALTKAMKRASTRFRRKVSVDKLADLLGTVHKSESDDVKARLRQILSAAFAGAATDLVASESELIDALARQFATVYAVDLNFDLVNQKAVEYLQTHADNYFTTLSDEQADGLLKVAGDTLAAKDGFTIRDVAKGIRDVFLNSSLYYGTDTGTRTLSVDQWAMLTSRTETARAASFAQKATLESVGMKSWTWQSQDSCCDDCDSNDDAIVLIGEPFPSGDSEPPLHPNCRCVVTGSMAELDTLGDAE